MPDDFDVFLSHNSHDKDTVIELAEALVARDLRPWLDVWHLVPGRSWQQELEEVIETIPAAAVLVGADGQGPWQEQEMRACLSELVERKLPVIPVLLPGAPQKPKLPLFLKGLTWVDLRDGMSGEGLDRLIFGIHKGERLRPKESDDPPDLEALLDTAYRQKAELEALGKDTTFVVKEIRGLLRQQREGPSLRSGSVGKAVTQMPSSSSARSPRWRFGGRAASRKSPPAPLFQRGEEDSSLAHRGGLWPRSLAERWWSDGWSGRICRQRCCLLFENTRRGLGSFGRT